MAEFNYATKEINVKIVYYGPGLCGKTTNLHYIHSSVDKENRGEMIALATKTDRTLYFDFLPIHAGTIHGFKTRFLLYTVPGQVYYDSTRKVVLRGADGVVFVADSTPDRMEANLESLRNLESNLREHKMDLDTVPWVLQFNKRDLANALPVEVMTQKLNPRGVPAFKGVAVSGIGVFEILHKLLGMTMKHLNQKAIEAGRGALFGMGQKSSTSDFENMSWFGDLANPPKLDPTAEIRQGVVEEVKLDSKPKPKVADPEPIIELPIQINLDSSELDPESMELPELELPEVSVTPQLKNTKSSTLAAPPVREAMPADKDRVLRVKKTVELPLPVKGREVPSQIQLNLVLNIKLVPQK